MLLIVLFCLSLLLLSPLFCNHNKSAFSSFVLIFAILFPSFWYSKGFVYAYSVRRCCNKRPFLFISSCVSFFTARRDNSISCTRTVCCLRQILASLKIILLAYFVSYAQPKILVEKFLKYLCLFPEIFYMIFQLFT